MTAPIILHYTSSHPMSTKKAVLNSEIQRAMRVSSDRPTTERSLIAIRNLFIQNGYPENIIKRSITTNRHNFQHHNRKFKTNKQDKPTVYMQLPYINEDVVRRVNGILRGSKAPIRPVWINDHSLEKVLVSSALTNPPCPSGNRHCHTCTNGLQGKCNTKNVIYKITCT